MLNIIYHKTFKETGFKKCVQDDVYYEILDFVEWFDSPALIDRREKKVEKKEKVSRAQSIKERFKEKLDER